MSRRARFDLGWFLPVLWRHRRPLEHVLLAAFLLQVIAVTTPLFSQVIIDKVLMHKSMSTLHVLGFGMLGLIVFEAVARVPRGHTLAHTAARLDAGLGSELFSRMLGLPVRRSHDGAADLDSSHQRLRQNREQAARLAAELGARPGAASLSDTQQATRDAREAAHAATLSAARAAVQEKTRALAAARSVETKLRLNLELASRRYAQNLVLFKEGFFSEAERMKQQQEVLSLQHDLAAHVETLAQLQAALDEARHRQTMVDQERRVQILAEAEQAAREGYALQAEYDKAERMNAAKTLLAPVAGIVQSLGVSTLGSAVAANQPLVTLVPDGMPLIAEVQLSNQDIGYVKAGQVVELKLDSFPFTQYGTVEGRVSWISADAELQNGASSGSAPAPGAQRAQGLSYRVHVTPTGPALLRRGEPVRLQAGMSLQADIQTDRRKLIRFILDPLQKGLGEGLRVR